MTAAEEALAAGDKLLARLAPYEELMAALDSCAALPDAGQVMPGLAQRLVTIAAIYQRDVAECRSALELLFATEPDPVLRASSALMLCRRHRDLAHEYLSRVIADLASVPDTATVPEHSVSSLHAHAQAILAAAAD